MNFNFIRESYSESRDQTADLLKGFAVLMMIQVHLTELFALDEINRSLAGSISLFLGGPPAAPLFMAVMGYFLGNTKKSLLVNFKRGLTLITGGILLNIGLNLHLLILIFGGEVQLDPLKYILGADILPLAGLSIIIISVINKISLKSFFAGSMLTTSLVTAILIIHNLTNYHTSTNLILIYVQAFLWGNLDWSYFPFLPWAVYPLIGYLYKILYEHFKPESAFIEIFVLVSSIITFVTISYGVDIGSDLKEYYHHDWVYSLWIFQFLILITFSIKQIELYCGKHIFLVYLKWLGKNVSAAYVIQWLLIGNIATLLFRTQNEIMSAIWFIVILAATSVMIYYTEKWKEKTLKAG